VIHAYDVPYERMVYPSLSPDDLEEYRERWRTHALHACNPLTFQECAIGCASGGESFSGRIDAIRDLCLADPTVTCAELHAAALQYCA